MKALQRKAMQQASDDIDKAYTIILMEATKPSFGNPCSREDPAGKATSLLHSAKEWIMAALEDK